MRTACFIPIKAQSERVPGKNLRMLNGKKLYEHICEHVLEANVFDDVWIDTNSEEIAAYAAAHGIGVIERKPELLLNSANGNDLLMHHYSLYPDYDYYFQLFATAPFLQPGTIRQCFEKLTMSGKYDSCLTAVEHHGFFWRGDAPVNYRPGILPRSQDLQPVLEETTGLYGISRGALEHYRCRIGSNPFMCVVDKFEAVDINTETDMVIAEIIGRTVFGL